ncbi:serine protease HTRA1B-like [Macrobrachium nipponense]|uniref:serine protease HTRA1B-like n=1 Tax=Macrobrachium nipponense TaxID=159736 RepID=UPI0030C8C2AB
MIGKSALLLLVVLDVAFGFVPLYAVSRDDNSSEETVAPGLPNARPLPSGGTPVVDGGEGVLPSGGSPSGAVGSPAGGSDQIGVLPGVGGVVGTGGGSVPLGPCDDVCTKILEPLCGSDGLSYNNKCILKNASCRSELNGGQPITILHMGFCEVRG